MSTIHPATTAAILGAPGLLSLADTADDNPIVATELNAAFGQYSHSPIAGYVTTLAMAAVAYYGLQMPPEIAALLAGALGAASAYLYSIITRRMSKAAVTQGTTS